MKAVMANKIWDILVALYSETVNKGYLESGGEASD